MRKSQHFERTFADVFAMPESSTRTVTADGYLTAPATLARAGVFKYLAAELGLTDRKPNDVINVYRSADALAKATETFESQTITLDHKWTNAKNWRDNAVGDVRDVEMQGDAMIGTLIIRDDGAIKAIDEAKMTQLSNGYAARLLRRAGKHLGQDYEYEQTDFHGNHIAIVGAARCGSECRIGDSAGEKEKTMVTRNFDGLTATMENEQSGQVFDRLLHLCDERGKEIATLKAVVPKIKLGDKELDGDAVRVLVEGKDAEIKTLKDAAQTPEQVHALVVARSNAIANARELVPDLKITDADTAHTIRVTALDAVISKDEMAKTMLDAALGTIKLADAKPEVVETAFNTIAAGLKKARDARKVTDSRKQIGSLATATAAGDDTDPRQAYMDAQRQAWKGAPATAKSGVN
jgi:hypothetical protein